MKIIIALMLGFAAQLLSMPAAKADPDTCRVAADNQWYDGTGQRCRGDDLDQWRVGNSPQLTCWWYPSRCEDHPGAGPGAR